MLATNLKQLPYSRWEDVCYPVSTILEMVSALCKERLSIMQQACVNDISDAVSRLLMLSNLLVKREGKTRSSGTPPYILLVEDNDIVATVENNLLTNLGCEVDVATNATDALTLITTHDYDLILLDVGLPDISGIELAKTLRFCLKDQCPHLIAVTALSDETMVQACLAAGIEQVLTKPVTLNTFKHILASINNHLPNREPV